MRVCFVIAALVSVGCVGANDTHHGPCDDLLSCAAVAAPDKLNEHLGNYGANGTCWKSLERTLCEKSCTALIAQIAASKPGVTECAGPISHPDASTSNPDASTSGGNDMAAPGCGPLTCGGCCAGGMCRTGSTEDACGNGGGSCVQCVGGKVCSAARICEADLNEALQLFVVDAAISSSTPAGAPWDTPFGDPDPFVTINGYSTGTQNDTLSPRWNAAFTFTRKELMIDGVVVSVFDKDVTYDDRVAGPRTLRVTETDLSTGKIDWYSWDSVRRISFTVRK